MQSAVSGAPGEKGFAARSQNAEPGALTHKPADMGGGAGVCGKIDSEGCARSGWDEIARQESGFMHPYSVIDSGMEITGERVDVN